MIKLIAFLDGSIYSKSVCEYAAWIAAKVGGSVDLVHVLGRRIDGGLWTFPYTQSHHGFYNNGHDPVL
jgi:hypothetical protein